MSAGERATPRTEGPLGGPTGPLEQEVLGERATPGGTGAAISLADLDVTPGRYGHPSLVAPLLSSQEVWAAGVTYESSKLARMGESMNVP